MKIPKLSPTQWFKLVVSLLPLLRGFVRAAGVGVVTVIRALIDIVGQVESLFPETVDPETGRVVKRGTEKLQAFCDLVIAGFARADESAEDVEARLGDLSQVASVIVTLFNQWGVLDTSARA